jgi:prolactin regulatory element-binding protein
MSQIPTASLDLGYPPWALQFDPYDRDYLVISGGGGGGQKEVPNKISVLDVSSNAEISNVSELQIADDSPASLGLLANKDGLYAFAGINSSRAEQQAGTNEHFRSFRVAFPEIAKDVRKKSKPGKVEALGKATLFSEAYLKSSDSYQRILRLSPPDTGASGNKRIAAIASSLSTPSEIVFLDATNATPSSKDAFYRIEPPNNAEPNDIDLFKVKEGEFMYAYCTNKDIYVGNVAFDFRNRTIKSQPKTASCIHSTPTTTGPRIKYRALRFLSEKFLLVLLNKGSQSELLLFRIYPDDGLDARGDIFLQKQLPARFGTAVALDTTILDSASPDGEYQVVVAIAAQARDIAILTIDMPAKGVPPSGFKLYKELHDVHEVPMKKIALSSFVSPFVPNSRFKRRSGPFFVRVASISLSNVVVVQSLELQPIGYRSRKPRHVLGQAANLVEYLRSGTSLMVIGFMLLVTLILAQSVLDAQAAAGQVSNYRVLPQRFHSFVTRARRDNDPVKNVIHNLADSHSKSHSLLDMIKKHGHEDQKHIVIRPHVDGDSGELVSEVHHDDTKLVEDEKVKKWDDMSEKEQAAWKKRLVDAGQWSVGQGDTILKSIFFSEAGGAWGNAAMQAILGG